MSKQTDTKPIQLPDFSIEEDLWRGGCEFVAGADEAGRGCLAGPVVAAAVILAPDADLGAVRDSKVVPEDEREGLAGVIKKTAVAWAIASCSPEEIDSLNILWASMEAMSRAVAGLDPAAVHVLADGNHTALETKIPWTPIIKGDARSLSIAAASILAKVERDNIMRQHAASFPEYGWDTNFGYPTEFHYEALSTYGSTALHRRSFRLFDQQFDLFQEKKIPPPRRDLPGR